MKHTLDNSVLLSRSTQSQSAVNLPVLEISLTELNGVLVQVIIQLIMGKSKLRIVNPIQFRTQS